ncbi:hypothetical protein ACLBXX_14805 [Microbacterium sp. C23T]
MLQALAVVAATGIGAAVTVVVFFAGNGSLTKIEQLSAVIERTEPGQHRDALVAVREQMTHRYLQRAAQPGTTQAIPWLFTGTAIMAVGLFGTIGLTQFLVDITQATIASVDDLRPFSAVTSAVSVSICLVGLAVSGVGLVKMFRGR